MTKSDKTQFFVQEMYFAVQSFQNAFNDLSKQAFLLSEHEEDEENTAQRTKTVPITAIFPIATMATLLIEITERVESIVVEVGKIAAQAEFEVVNHEKNKENKN